MGRASAGNIARWISQGDEVGMCVITVNWGLVWRGPCWMSHVTCRQARAGNDMAWCGQVHTGCHMGGVGRHVMGGLVRAGT